jgi:hypothetical protein
MTVTLSSPVRRLGQACCGLALVVSLGAIAPVAQAQPQTTNRPVITQISPSSLKTLLNNEGYSEIKIEDSRILVFKIEGTTVVFVVSDDGNSGILRASWSGTGVSLKSINEWNATKRFSRAYLDQEGDPVIEMDFDLGGGVTIERFQDFMDTAKISIALFQDQVLAGGK